MDISELKEKSVAELYASLKTLRKNLWDLKMQGNAGQSSHHHQFGQLRKDIARVQTILNERKR